MIFPHISTPLSNQSPPTQLLPIFQPPPPAFEPPQPVRMSTEYNYKYMDNNALLLLPFPMPALNPEGFRSRSAPTNFQSSLQRSHFPLFDLLCAPSGLSASTS